MIIFQEFIRIYGNNIFQNVLIGVHLGFEVMVMVRGLIIVEYSHNE